MRPCSTSIFLPAINGSVLNVARKFRANASPLKIRFMDVSEALKGHRLCEKGVGLIEDIPGFFGSGTDATVVDKVEWVTEARTRDRHLWRLTPSLRVGTRTTGVSWRSATACAS